MPDPLGGLAYVWPLYAGGLIAYLIGSIPFGLLLTRFAGLGDVRKIGSGSIGATNVLRTGRKDIAVATLLLDGGKGAVAVLIARACCGPDMAVIAALASVVGHLFPVWLGFRGGKGVATGLGVLIALAWPVALLAALTWLAVAVVFRYSSLASLVAVTSAPLYAWWLADAQRTELTLALAVLIVIRHHGNIRRLIRGEESKINFGKS